MRPHVALRYLLPMLLAGLLARCSSPGDTSRVPTLPATVAVGPTPLGQSRPFVTVTAAPAALVPASSPSPASTIPVYGYRVVKAYPHDRGAFTEGLAYVDDQLYESTGLNGKSSLRRVDLATGRVLQQRDLNAAYFGEGIAILDGRIVQLTWQSHVGFVYDRGSFAPQRQFGYRTEGWGLAADGVHLIMSDGTATLHWLDPQTFQETRSVAVRDDAGPVTQLNELECIDGEIYANIWQTDRIARIDPQTGRVTAWIDLQGLLGEQDRAVPVDVLNGIAYDARRHRLFVTGKLWPKLFEIELVPPARRH